MMTLLSIIIKIVKAHCQKSYCWPRSSNTLTNILKDDQGLIKALIDDLAQRFCLIFEGFGRSLPKALQNISLVRV